jgi:YtoQ family protein
MEERLWNVYLSGEIHTNWREWIQTMAGERNLPVRLMSPILDHKTSDECGERLLGPETDAFWRDHKSARINAIRNRSVMRNSDIVVVRFGEKYRQWNAAYDAGLAVAWGKSLITLHDAEFDHALKEIDASASAVARNIDQVVEILQYITSQPF